MFPIRPYRAELELCAPIGDISAGNSALHSRDSWSGGNHTRRRGLHEGGFAQVDRFELFTWNKIVSPGAQSAQQCGVGKKRPPAGEPFGDFRAYDRFALLDTAAHLVHARQSQPFGLAPGRRFDLVGGEIKFIALGIDDDADPAPNVLLLCRSGQAIDAVDPDSWYFAGQLPALRQRDGRSDSGVGTGPESDGDAFHLLTFEACLAQRSFNEAQRAPTARAAVLRPPANLAVVHDGNAPQGRG